MIAMVARSNLKTAVLLCPPIIILPRFPSFVLEIHLTNSLLATPKPEVLYLSEFLKHYFNKGRAS